MCNFLEEDYCTDAWMDGDEGQTFGGALICSEETGKKFLAGLVENVGGDESNRSGRR